MTESRAPISLDEMILALDTLPPLPELVADLVCSLDDDSADLDAIVAKLERDPVLSGKALRIANSPFFGLSGQIDTLKHATTVLGFNTLRSLVLVSAFGNMRPPASDADSVLRPHWLHSLQTALAARALAPALQLAPEPAFLAGLLHDIGKLALVVLQPERMIAAEAWRAENGTRWAAAEAEFGLPSSDALGGALARHWRFPIHLCEVIAYHASPAVVEHLAPHTALVHLACALSQALDIAASDGRHRIDVAPAAWAQCAKAKTALPGAVRAMLHAEHIAAQLA